MGLVARASDCTMSEPVWPTSSFGTEPSSTLRCRPSERLGRCVRGLARRLRRRRAVRCPPIPSRRMRMGRSRLVRATSAIAVPYASVTTDRVYGMDACNALAPSRGAFPMNCVRWIDAARYCAWGGKRLPTEHEWCSSMRLHPPRDAGELLRAVDVLVPEAETRIVDVSAQHVATNGVSEWTRSSTCTHHRCIDFHRIIVRDGARGGPFRLRGLTNLWPTKSADLGFRCAR